jgi:hypothetical protein
MQPTAEERSAVARTDGAESGTTAGVGGAETFPFAGAAETGSEAGVGAAIAAAAGVERWAADSPRPQS